jgi:succinoglycan biosynthesis transport protein ExoP
LEPSSRIDQSRKGAAAEMFNPDNRDQGKLPHSLLSLGQSGEKPMAPSAQARPQPASLTSMSSTGPSASERHRLARSKREATPNPLLSALAAKPDVPSPAPPSEKRWSGMFPSSKPASQPPKAVVPTSVPAAESEAVVAAYSNEAPPATAPRIADGQWRPLIDPLKIVGGIVKSRNIILATTVAGALLGVALALSTPKQFESVAELLVDPRDIKIVDREVTQGGLPSDATLAIVENQVRVLTSGSVLEKVVDKLNLAADPEFNGQKEGFGIRSLISEVRSIFSRDEGGGDVRRALAIRNLGEALQVERGGKTFVVSIGAITEDAQKSALIANTLTETFLQSYGDIQSVTAGRASDELTSRLAELQTGVEEAERKVEAFKAENDLIDAQGRLISDDEMVKLNEQLSIARARTIELNARAASARDLNLDSVVGGELPEQISSPVMAELRSQYAVSKQEVERLSVRLGPRHPERLAAEAQLSGARESLASELRRIVSSIQVDLRRAVQLEQDLASRLAQLKVRQGAVSEDLVTVRELEREAAAKRAVYESFLLRARETNEQRGMNTANMSVISVAQPALEPLGPSRSMTVIFTTILGFMAGVGIGGVRGAVDSLRGGSTPGEAPARPAAVRAPGRKGLPDEIDRIMKTAAEKWTAEPPTAKVEPEAKPIAKSEETVVVKAPADPDEPKPQAGKPDKASTASSAAPAQKDPSMQPAYPYPYAPVNTGHAQAPVPQYAAPMGPSPAQAWYEQQAAIAAHQNAVYQAWLAARPQQPQYAPPAPPQPQWSHYPQQPVYTQQVYPQPQMPMNMQTPPAWPAWPQHSAPPAWSPAPEPMPQPQMAAPRRETQPEPTPVDEIRESLREFRNAVRDLADIRSRGRDY